MGLVLDLIIIAIIAIGVVISAKKGFVRTAIEVVGFVVAIILAFTISEPLADFAYEKVVEDSIVSAANTSVENLKDKVWESLPDFVTENSDTFGITKNEVGSVIDKNAHNGSEAAVRQVSDTLVKPVTTKLIGGLIACILFIILLIIVKILAKFINKLFSFSFIGTINTVLGGVTGVVKGVIYALIFVAVTVFVAGVSKGGFLIFTDKNIASSCVYKFFAEILSIYPFK